MAATGATRTRRPGLGACCSSYLTDDTQSPRPLPRGTRTFAVRLHAATVRVKRTASRIDSSHLFEDPDGIRLEVNHVPGKGLLG